MTIIDLDNWSKQAANEYLTHKTPLNDSILKLASDHGLNRDQVNRVTEAANTEVYINLFNNATDKYIEYETADSEKIAERLFGVEKRAASDDSDYDELPLSDPVSDAGDASLTKLATSDVDLPTTNTEALHEYYKLAALETRLKGALDEVDVAYQTDASILFSLIKQAVLGGTSFGDIQAAITSLHADPVIEINLQEVREKIASEIYPEKLNDTRTSYGTVNADNALVKQASRLVKHAQEYTKLKSKHAQALDELRDTIKTGGVFGAMGRSMKGSVAGGAALVAAGAVGGGIAVDQISKKRTQQKAMAQQMKTLPNAYTR